jgi:hypothetical protein
VTDDSIGSGKGLKLELELELLLPALLVIA